MAYRRELAQAASETVELVKVENAHPHRLRDTFCVELLLTGVPIEQVSILLGHRQLVRTQGTHICADEHPLSFDRHDP